MNFYKGIKKTLLFTIITVLFLFGFNKVFASDYQYKILDPKYNPAAEKLINGELSKIEDVQTDSKKNGFDFVRFLAIFATIAFPIFVLMLASKAYKRLLYGVPGTGSNEDMNIEIGNIKIEQKKQQDQEHEKSNDALVQLFGNSNDGLMFLNLEETYTSKDNSVNTMTTNDDNIVNKKSQNVVSNVVEKNIKRTIEKPVLQEPKTLIQHEEVLKKALAVSFEQHMKKTATTTITKRNPMLLNTAPLTKEKGLCLVEYENKYSLFGYIKNKIFFLNQFETLKSSEIRPRLTERNEGKDRYLVRLGSYKGLIEVSDVDMNLLINL